MIQDQITIPSSFLTNRYVRYGHWRIYGYLSTLENPYQWNKVSHIDIERHANLRNGVKDLIDWLVDEGYVERKFEFLTENSHKKSMFLRVCDTQTSPRRSQEFIDELNSLAGHDPESEHDAADEVLLRYIEKAGDGDVAKAYRGARNRVGFYYA